jgi:general secretion pathway protein K
MIKYNKNKGAALITALIIVFLIMAIISDIMVSNYKTIRRIANQKIQEQAYSILTAAVSFGRAGLATSAITSPIDTLTDIWAQPFPKTKVLENIFMSGYIIDEQSKFNINDLINNGVINNAVLREFQNLLKYLNIPIQIANEIALYITEPIYQKDILNKYTLNNPAYRPAGRPLLDLSELILVKGMRSDWLYKLNNYITAIPKEYNLNESKNDESKLMNPEEIDSNSVTINVNTASAEVIAARLNIPIVIAQRMVTIRINKAFKNNNDVIEFLTTNGVLLNDNTNKVVLTNITTNSEYFTIHVVVDSGDYNFNAIAFVNRKSRNGQWPIILWQHVN